MKYIHNRSKLVIVLLLIVSATISCEEDFLSENPTDRLDLDSSFSTIEDAEVGLIGCYSVLQANSIFNAAGYPFYWGDLGVDTFTVFPFNPDRFLHSYTIDPSDLTIERAWIEHYQAIKVVNVFLGRARLLSIENANTEASPENIESFNNVKNRIIAEASFIRAVLYFNLVKMFGNIPLNINEGTAADINDELLPSVADEEIYRQIEKDLLFAEQWLDPTVNPSQPARSRDIANVYAVKGLLGKIYLQMTTSEENQGVGGGIDQEGNVVSIQERFQMAKEKFQDIIDSNVYSLMDNYADVFDPSMENQNTELIFSVGFDGPGNSEGSTLGDVWGANGSPPGGAFNTRDILHAFALSYLEFDDITLTGGNFSTQQVNNFLFPFGTERRFQLISDARFHTNVSRYNAGFFNRGGSIDSDEQDVKNAVNVALFQWRPLKYQKPLGTEVPFGDQSFDFPYMRFADILLLQAEVHNELNEPEQALSLVNQVRNRAFKNVTNAQKLERIEIVNNGFSKDDILNIILRERRWELAFEGHRKDDLIRTNKLRSILQDLPFNNENNPVEPITSYREFKNIWPIPLTEVNLNSNAIQNCGYEAEGKPCFD